MFMALTGAWPSLAAAQGAPAHDPATPYAVAAYLLGILSVFLLGLVIVLAGRLYQLKASGRDSAPGPAGAAPGAVKPDAAPTALEGDDTQEDIEESKLAIQGLLRKLAECVSGLIEDQATYDNKMEKHKLAIQKAMTLAGLEEIERLLLREIEEMRQSGQRYRAQLSQAHARIHEQNEAMARIQADARLDFLTQLPNRGTFEARLAEEFERTRRYGNPLSLIMLDIDLFKRVNDTHGHPAGDKILQLVALQLQKNIRKSDLACRYGGEEFAIVLPETALRPARLAAEKVRQVIERDALMFERAVIRVTISAGVGQADPAHDTASSLLARVDAALYRAKQNGRNRVELAEEAAAPPPEKSSGD